MNRREKEAYLREYSLLKAEGKPFFPYAVAQDSIMACIVMAVIITLSIVLGAELGPKADPTTTTYVPRPEWYFFFLFEVLRVIKPPALVPLATIGVPTIGMILLFLLPLFDRGPERRPERRPIATLTGILVIAAMAYLTYMGAVAGSPTADSGVQSRGGSASADRAMRSIASRSREAAARSARAATAATARSVPCSASTPAVNCRSRSPVPTCIGAPSSVAWTSRTRSPAAPTGWSSCASH